MKKLALYITSITIISAIFVPNVFAQMLLNDDLRQSQNTQNFAFLERAGLSDDISVPQIIGYIIRIALGFLGIIFIVLIIYAGFLWMTARGNDEQIGNAKGIMTSAIIGLIVVLSAYLVTYVVVDKVLEATKGGQGLD